MLGHHDEFHLLISFAFNHSCHPSWCLDSSILCFLDAWTLKVFTFTNLTLSLGLSVEITGGKYGSFDRD